MLIVRIFAGRASYVVLSLFIAKAISRMATRQVVNVKRQARWDLTGHYDLAVYCRREYGQCS